ncbi:hypothetical protein [Sinomonas terrae]|uniref:Peptide zinc metalloprotease protein n=1 Tax=Sinomonas terrae TaxID=2908838 RepID=A0ABS9U5U4_9MICC|nr:hypothetical protein [Sinomonas terrae]MCH6472063.1 hypothetical protein [Sinomonas terrae]
MSQDLAAPPQRWERTAGLELLGLVSGSGLNHVTYLVRRSDGQVVQLGELLHLIITEAALPLPSEELARRVSAGFGRELDVEGLTLLAEKKLEPLGLLQHPEARVATPVPKATPLLALSAKTTLLPRSAVARLSVLLKPLYTAPVVVFACLALVGLDLLLFVRSNAAAALNDVLLTPGLLLSLFALMSVGALVHEVGHATACRYGGARPGVIGVGLYIIFPAFYTDVTDSYRLSRGGRIRTDLGGLYFHLWWVLGAGLGYLATGSPLLLLLVIMTQLQMAQQLPPAIRLDGYFVLADLAGVPDLFARVGPVLRSLVPGRGIDRRVSELRPLSRWIVTSWVLVVVPFLAGVVVWLALSLPYILSSALTAVAAHARNLSIALATGQPLEAALSVLAITLIALPAVGSVLILAQAFGTVGRAAIRRLTPRAPRPLPRHAIPSRRLRIGRHS